MQTPLFHGTSTKPAQFEKAPPAVGGEGFAWSATRCLGIFFSECPRIAAHFALRPEVVDAGYDTPQGSALLRKDPWRLSPDPFQPAAEVLTCRLPDEVRLFPVPLLEWIDLCETRDATFWLTWRRELQARGFEGLRVEGWDGESEHPEFGPPCVEYHAPTVVCFDARAVRIVDRAPAAAAWGVPSPPRPRLSMP